MKKKFRGLLLLLLAVVMLCSTGCGILFGDSQQATEESAEPTTEYTEPATTVPEETEPPYTVMVITGNPLNIRSGPGTDYEVVGQLQRGDLVQVWEVADGWGQIEQGWISLTYAEEYQGDEDSETSSNSQNTDSEYTETPEQTTGQTQDLSYLLEGVWYSYYAFGNGEYSVNCREFRTTTYEGTVIREVIDEYYDYNPATGERYMTGKTDGVFSYDGQILNIFCPPYTDEGGNNYAIVITGNVMDDGDAVFYRMSWEEIKAQIDREYYQEPQNADQVGG